MISTYSLIGGPELENQLQAAETLCDRMTGRVQNGRRQISGRSARYQAPSSVIENPHLELLQ